MLAYGNSNRQAAPTTGLASEGEAQDQDRLLGPGICTRTLSNQDHQRIGDVTVICP